MRLFVALPLPAGVVAALARIQQGVPGARWVPPENMHLTLRFIGEVDGGVFEDLVEALAEVTVTPFDLEIAGTGHFETKRLPTIIATKPCKGRWWSSTGPANAAHKPVYHMRRPPSPSSASP